MLILCWLEQMRETDNDQILLKGFIILLLNIQLFVFTLTFKRLIIDSLDFQVDRNLG